MGLRLPKGDAARGMLLVDKDQRVDLAMVDRDGKLLKGGGTVDIALYQLDWRWWWEKGDESLAQRADELYQRPIKKDTVTIGPDGRGSWTFQVKYPSWGRYLVRVEDKQGGHAAGKIVYIDWPGWAGRGRDSGGAEAMLELSVGAPKYAPGDKASVSFPSNENGSALVQIERAGRILREEWVPTKKETTAYAFEVTPDMAPNVYVHVTFVQPHLQTANDLPIRLYGVVPVMVEDPATRVRPILTTPATLAPEGQASFTVREEKGRPMTYTVAVVDEGLLGITRYQTPDPWNEFYKKEASSLSAWDLYQYVAGAFSGKLETLLAVGGSDEALGAGNRKPSRFPAVVYYFPPRELKAGETASLSFKLGTYIGALRFMVVAATMPSQMAGGASPAGGARLRGGRAIRARPRRHHGAAHRATRPLARRGGFDSGDGLRVHGREEGDGHPEGYRRPLPRRRRHADPRLQAGRRPLRDVPRQGRRFARHGRAQAPGYDGRQERPGVHRHRGEVGGRGRLDRHGRGGERRLDLEGTPRPAGGEGHELASRSSSLGSSRSTSPSAWTGSSSTPTAAPSRRPPAPSRSSTCPRPSASPRTRRRPPATTSPRPSTSCGASRPSAAASRCGPARATRTIGSRPT